MQKNILLILLLSATFHFSNAQSSVAIGSNTPNPKAVLWLNTQGGQGLLLPSLSTSSRTGMGLNNSTEKGMLVYDNQLDRIFFWNGIAWIEAVGGGGVEVDGIVGNEVAKVTTDRGLVLTGSGTAGSPLSVGLMDGNADQQVLKWNNTTKKWELGTDAGAAFVAGAGIQISGTTLINSGDTDATNDLTTASVAVGDVTGPFSNLQIAPTTVTATELADNAVTNLKIADDAVTVAKIGTAGATDALKVMTTDASGNPQWSLPTASGDMLKTVYDPSGANANAFDLNNHTGDIATAQIENGAITPAKITGAGAGVRGILGSDNNAVTWVTGTPSQLLGTDAAGAFQFTDKSNFLFSTPNVIPKGSASGLVSSQLIDDGTNVGIGTSSLPYKLNVEKTLASANDAHVFAFNPSNTTGDKSSIRLGVGSFWAVHLQTSLSGNWLELTNNAGTPVHTWDFDSYRPGNGLGYLQGSGGELFLRGGNVQVDNYTKLGSSAPAIQTAVLTGTTSSTEGGLVNLSFAGITTRDKIISITVMVDWSGSGSDWIQPSWVNSSGYYFNWLVNSTTNLAVVNQLNNSAVPPQRSNFILSKAIKAYIVYTQ